MGRIEDLIKRDLNTEVIIQKFKRLARERGFRYSHIEFQNVEVEDGSIIIKVKVIA